jgi:hypothetical protein
MPKTPKIRPFQNEADVVLFGELSVENRIDRVSIHGSLDITRDRPGLADAKALKACLDAIIQALEGETELPDQVAGPKPSDTVDNPFA